MAGKRPLRIAAGVVVALALVMLIVVAGNWSAVNRLEGRIAALRAAGEPVTLADLGSPSLAAEDNAAVFLAAARDDLHAVHARLSAIYEREGFFDGRLEESDLETIRSVMDEHAEVFALPWRAGGWRSAP